jgi:hypothetical protein
MTDEEREDRVMELSEKIYKKSASADEEDEFFGLLKSLISDLRQDLDKSKMK